MRPGAATAFRILVQPAAVAVAGGFLPVQPAVIVIDKGGNPANSSSSVEVLFQDYNHFGPCI